MQTRVEQHGLAIDRRLHDFMATEVLDGLGIDPDYFWAGFAAAVREFTPRNIRLLEERAGFQKKISAWLRDNRGRIDPKKHRAFLEDIGYIIPEGDAFSITTTGCDDEITGQPGPQLVVPLLNARYTVNAANSRWKSLYDALYGTDALGDAPDTPDFDETRSRKTIAFVRDHLDSVAPLHNASHADATSYTIKDGALAVETKGGDTTQLADPTQFKGWRGTDPAAPDAILLAVNRLHIEIIFDPDSNTGKIDPANIGDVIVEAAISTIVDLEDSIAAVDGEDKTEAYRNWLGLMKGELTASLVRGGKPMTRSLEPDREYNAPDNSTFTLHGRSLLLIRNVGHLMTSPEILDSDGNEVFEGIMDAFITAAIALYDLRGLGKYRNSRTGSMYVVKPKMHGPAEVAFAVDILAAAEKLLGMEPATIKIGIMDEERRTSLNLKESIRAASNRVAFINTGFLDRTGDEIHTSMEAGAMIPKTEMKAAHWIAAYEDWNMDTGLACGLAGRAQIGKGMWAMPDLMADMLKTKSAHPEAGANTAWVPSPTAATLHALHYHKTAVLEVQEKLMGKPRRQLDDLLAIPLAHDTNWPEETITAELNNNAQGLLGYVVRWIDQGIGCSKVPDINDIGLMEDRATLRISSQHIANWLHHGIVDESRVMEALKEMAAVVDRQNADDPDYIPMTDDLENSVAFTAAKDLVFKGINQPSGYTEPLLHHHRLRAKELS